VAFAGWVHLLARRYAEAERFLDAALSIAPDLGSAHPNRIFLYQSWTGDQEKVREVIGEMIRNAEPAVVAMALGQGARGLVAEGAYDDAFEQLTPASFARTFPFNYSFVKAEFYRLRGQPDRARAYCDSLLAALEDQSAERATDPNLAWYLAYAYAGLGRTEQAIHHAERTLSLLAASGDALQAAYMQHNLILVYAMVGEYDAALSQIEYLLSVPSLISVPYLRVEQFPGTLSDQPGFQRLLEQGN
jgi:tetratricopeptide (TPR) repeat protein